MLFDLVTPKIMTVYVAEIKGRGIAAFHANNGSDAERLVRDPVFRDDFMVLATGGLPLWDGVTDIEGFSASTLRRDLNMSATNITSKCRIASIGPDDVMILPHDANPGRMKFSEDDGVREDVLFPS